MEKKYLFGWKNLRWFIVEVVRTFSNEPSFFARKRFEGAILFVNAMILLDVWYVRNFDKIDYVEALAVFGAQMVYAGYQVTQIRKDIEMKAKTTEEKT